MTHLPRRLAYLLFGVAPAAPLALVSAAVPPFGIGAVIGFFGAAVSLVLPYPCPDRVYRRTAIAIGIGICSLTPVSVLMTLDELRLFAALIDPATSSWNIAGKVARSIWLFWGPILCGVHFLVAARRAPNNSSKPTPLRGAA